MGGMGSQSEKRGNPATARRMETQCPELVLEQSQAPSLMAETWPGLRGPSLSLEVGLPASLGLRAHVLLPPPPGVCQVDKQNRAGYSPIMLTALATLKNQDDIETLLQLFRLGDVNAKASQVGPGALQTWAALPVYRVLAVRQAPT